MKKLLREDGPILLISLVITYFAFRSAEGWGWNIIGAAIFAAAVGLVCAAVIQGLVVLWHHKRSGSDQEEPGNGERAARADAENSKEGQPGWREDVTGESPHEEDASGTGADESGPRGPVRRSEGYRSSLEDPE